MQKHGTNLAPSPERFRKSRGESIEKRIESKKKQLQDMQDEYDEIVAGLKYVEIPRNMISVTLTNKVAAIQQTLSKTTSLHSKTTMKFETLLPHS